MEDAKVNSKNANPSVMHSFKDNKAGIAPMKVLIVLIIVFALGSGTGYLLSGSSKATKNVPLNSKDGSSGKIYGSDDTETFKDIAEGKLEEGGIDGEGQFHLVRAGGDSQNVYMTSSTVDLSQFVGKKIKVWGQTQTAQSAGWLMDVGRVEVL